MNTKFQLNFFLILGAFDSKDINHSLQFEPQKASLLEFNCKNMRNFITKHSEYVFEELNTVFYQFLCGAKDVLGIENEHVEGCATILPLFLVPSKHDYDDTVLKKFVSVEYILLISPVLAVHVGPM
ncbi:hypothetical protein CsSME_00038724 [Camellia sinensis var. sinensis]